MTCQSISWLYCIFGALFLLKFEWPVKVVLTVQVIVTCPGSLQGLYRAIMAKATRLGVLVVKAAGNSGGDGPFRADAATVVRPPSTF